MLVPENQIPPSAIFMLVGIIVLIAGIAAFLVWNKKISKKDKFLGQPHPIGSKVYAGTSYSGLHAYLRVESYDEEKKNVHCAVLVEAPPFSINQVVNFINTPGKLPDVVTINFELNGAAFMEIINLTYSEFSNSPYYVSVVRVRSIFKEQKSTD